MSKRKEDIVELRAERISAKCLSIYDKENDILLGYVEQHGKRIFEARGTDGRVLGIYRSWTRPRTSSRSRGPCSPRAQREGPQGRRVGRRQLEILRG